MCWMCKEFGNPEYGNGLWYLNPYNYARNMYKLREPGEGFKGADAGLETGARERGSGPTQADLMRAIEEGNAEEAARILPILQERVKTGVQPSQVVPLKDADKVLELCSPIGLGKGDRREKRTRVYLYGDGRRHAQMGTLAGEIQGWGKVCQCG